MANIHNENVKAIILVGDRDFGRCRLASKVPYALWPVNGKPAISHLLKNLADDHITDVKICGANNNHELMHALNPPSGMYVEYIYEDLPLGTAGCIRESINHGEKCTLLVLSSNIVGPFRFRKLIESHNESNSVMTVFSALDKGECTEIYVCESSVVDLIPQGRYFDIKEELIPAMQRAGQLPCFKPIRQHLNYFSDSPSYINTQTNMMVKHTKNDGNFLNWHGHEDIKVSSDARIAVDAMIYGPVVIGKETQIESGSLIIGPTYIGDENRIGSRSVIDNCVLWNGSQIGSGCRLRNCVVENTAKITSGCNYNSDCITNDQSHTKAALRAKASICRKQVSISIKFLGETLNYLYTNLRDNLYQKLLSAAAKPEVYIAATAIIFAVFFWSYLPEIRDLLGVWMRNYDYSSGVLVPFVALYVIWANRRGLLNCKVKPSFWGIAVVLAAQSMRHFGLFYMYASAQRYSLVITVAGLTLLVLGWEMLKRTTPVLLFLFLMLPLPHVVDNSLGLPLQSLATKIAVGLLELGGFAVVRQGNVINIGDVTVAVAEACNGLRMITAFVTICAMVVMIARRSWWEKSLILLSSIPIAVFCNSLRLTITALVFSMFTRPEVRSGFHDFGGYAMMPVAIAIVFFELWILSKLTRNINKEFTAVAEK